MANLDPERTLIPRERKDGTWCVKAEKPDRIIQHIGDFNNEAEAQDWINHRVKRVLRRASQLVTAKAYKGHIMTAKPLNGPPRHASLLKVWIAIETNPNARQLQP